VPIFVYRCECGHAFERLVSRDADAPECPACGGATRKVPAAPSVGRVGGDRPLARGTARNDVPIPWRGVASGGPEKLQREVEFRQRLEARAVGGLRVPGGPDSHPDKGSEGSSGGQGSAAPLAE
jgi:putative FmdB family regulatory protein